MNFKNNIWARKLIWRQHMKYPPHRQTAVWEASVDVASNRIGEEI